MIDKRLATVEDVQHYAQMAKKTGRRLSLYDIDAPLEVSLAGVLERVPGGPDPLPDFSVVGQGFDAVRTYRKQVIALFVNDPALGSYELYATLPSGEKVRVATVSGGVLNKENPALYDKVTAAEGDVASGMGKQTITEDLITKMTAALPPQRATAVANTLRKYLGRTWEDALNSHSQETAAGGK
jgi:hypothetical protein